MRLYLDDDSLQDLLVRLLRQAGHDVQRSTDAGLEGSEDPVHFTRAIRDDRLLYTANHDDYFQLHLLVLQSQGHHPGLLVIRRDNNPRRDMTPRGIVNAIRKLDESGVPLKATLFILNDWR